MALFPIDDQEILLALGEILHDQFVMFPISRKPDSLIADRAADAVDPMAKVRFARAIISDSTANPVRFVTGRQNEFASGKMHIEFTKQNEPRHVYHRIVLRGRIEQAREVPVVEQIPQLLRAERLADFESTVRHRITELLEREAERRRSRFVKADAEHAR